MTSEHRCRQDEVADSFLGGYRYIDADALGYVVASLTLIQLWNFFHSCPRLMPFAFFLPFLRLPVVDFPCHVCREVGGAEAWR